MEGQRSQGGGTITKPSCHHVWGPGPDLYHRACDYCGHVVKLVWAKLPSAPPLPEDDVRGIISGGGIDHVGIEHIPTGVRVLYGDDHNFFQRPGPMWAELARRVAAHYASTNVSEQ